MIGETQDIGGDKIEIKGIKESVDRWFPILENDIQRTMKEEGKPINSIELDKRNRLLGDYFKRMSEIAEIEGRLIDLPIKGVGNSERMIVSSQGKGLYFQEEIVPEEEKTRVEFNFLGKDVVKTRLERAIKIYPDKIKELKEALRNQEFSKEEKAKINSRIAKLEISGGRCRVLLEKIFGERQG